MINFSVRRSMLPLLQSHSTAIVPQHGVHGLRTRPVTESYHPDIESVSLLRPDDQMRELYRINNTPVYGILTNDPLPPVQSIIPRYGASLNQYTIFGKNQNTMNLFLNSYEPAVRRKASILSSLPSCRIPLFEMLMIRDEEHFGLLKEPAYLIESLSQSLSAKIDDPMALLFRRVPFQTEGFEIAPNLRQTFAPWQTQNMPGLLATTSVVIRYEHNGEEFYIPYHINRTLLPSILANYDITDFHEQSAERIPSGPLAGFLSYAVRNSHAFSVLPKGLYPRFLHPDAQNIEILTAPDRIGDIFYIAVDTGPGNGPQLESQRIPDRTKFIFLMQNLRSGIPRRIDNPLPLEGFAEVESYRTRSGSSRLRISGQHFSPELHRVPHSWLGSLGLTWGDTLYHQSTDEITLTIIEEDGSKTEVVNPLNFITRRPELLTELPNESFPRIVDARAHGGIVIARYQRDDGTYYWDWAPEESLLPEGDYGEIEHINGGLAIINYTYGNGQTGETVFPIDNPLNVWQSVFDSRKSLFNPTSAKRVIEMVPAGFSEGLSTVDNSLVISPKAMDNFDALLSAKSKIPIAHTINIIPIIQPPDKASGQTFLNSETGPSNAASKFRKLTAIIGRRLNPLSPHNIDPIYYNIKPEILYYAGISHLQEHTLSISRNFVTINSPDYRDSNPNPHAIPRRHFIDNDNKQLFGNSEHPYIASPEDIYIPSSYDIPWLRKYRPKIGTFLGWAPDRVPRSVSDLMPEKHLWAEAKAMFYPVEKVTIDTESSSSYLPQGVRINSIAYACPASALQVHVMDRNRFGENGRRFWIPIMEPLGRIDNLVFADEIDNLTSEGNSLFGESLWL